MFLESAFIYCHDNVNLNPNHPSDTPFYTVNINTSSPPPSTHTSRLDIPEDQPGFQLQYAQQHPPTTHGNGKQSSTPCQTHSHNSCNTTSNAPAINLNLPSILQQPPTPSRPSATAGLPPCDPRLASRLVLQRVSRCQPRQRNVTPMTYRHMTNVEWEQRQSGQRRIGRRRKRPFESYGGGRV